MRSTSPDRRRAASRVGSRSLIIGGASPPRWVRALVLIAGLGIAGVAAPTGAVSAHGIVVDIDPADGSSLLIAPTDVVMTFSEPMLADGLTVDVSESGTATATSATVEVDSANARRIIVHLGEIADGTYQVRVSVRDREDLHLVVARTSFAVGEAAPAPSAPVIAGPEPVETGARWLFAAGLALLVGVAAVRTRWPNIRIDRPHRLHTIALAGITLVAVGRVGVLVARLLSLGGSRVGAARTVLGTDDARRVILVAIALACVAFGEVPRRALWLDVPLRAEGWLSCRLALAWIGLVDLAVLASWGAHSELNGSISLITVFAKTGHLIGLGLWVGVLAVVLISSTGATSRRAALASMSEAALFGAFLTVVSGLVLASQLVVSLTALAATTYGAVLAVKIGLLIVGVVAGIAMRRGSRADWSFGELGALSVVVLLGAAMATSGPAVDPGFTNDRTASSVPPAAVSADDLIVQARAIPAQPGVNTVEVRFGETRRPSPGDVTSIDILIGSETYTATPDAQGLAFATGVLLPEGQTVMSVVLHRDGWADAGAILSVATEPAVYVHPPWISSVSIRRPLLGIAIVVSMTGLLVRRRVGRRRTVDWRSTPDPRLPAVDPVSAPPVSRPVSQE